MLFSDCAYIVFQFLISDTVHGHCEGLASFGGLGRRAFGSATRRTEKIKFVHISLLQCIKQHDDRGVLVRSGKPRPHNPQDICRSAV